MGSCILFWHLALACLIFILAFADEMFEAMRFQEQGQTNQGLNNVLSAGAYKGFESVLGLQQAASAYP